MHLKILGSSSFGNSYILENESEALLIECGVKFSEVKKAVDFNISKINGCIVSHSHLDHCKYMNQVLDACIPVFISEGAFQGLVDGRKIKSQHRPNFMAHECGFDMGGFYIIPFDVKHDAPEPLGFLIHHNECGNLLFMTDSYYVEYTFPGLHNIMIEANYDIDILNRNVENGSLPSLVRNRVTQSHMSISTLKELLQANDLSDVNNVVLLHLSDGNSNAAAFKNAIEEVSGKNVVIAEKGLVVDFNKISF